MREAKLASASANCPATAKSATNSFSRGRMSGRHRNFVASVHFNAEIPRFDSSTSRAFLYTSQHTSNARSGLTPLAPPRPPPIMFRTQDRLRFNLSASARPLIVALSFFFPRPTFSLALSPTRPLGIFVVSLACAAQLQARPETAAAPLEEPRSF